MVICAADWQSYPIFPRPWFTILLNTSIEERKLFLLKLSRKPPSAELRPNQKDQDSLPSYDVLDGVLMAYVEESKDVNDIVRMGYDESLISKVDRNEYKTKAGGSGIKVTTKAFGTGRRMPLAYTR